MNQSKRLNEKLQHLLRTGATLTLTYGNDIVGPYPLAGASFVEGLFSFAYLWPRGQEDLLCFQGMSVIGSGKMLNLYRGWTFAGTVAGMEEAQYEEFNWEAWRTEGAASRAWVEEWLSAIARESGAQAPEGGGGDERGGLAPSLKETERIIVSELALLYTMGKRPWNGKAGQKDVESGSDKPPKA